MALKDRLPLPLLGLLYGKQQEWLRTRDAGAAIAITRGRTVEEDIASLQPNEVHAVIYRKDGTVENLGITTNLRTTAGLDWQADVMGNASQPASARWVGLTTNATAPAAGDTTLTSEIASGGLTRVAGTYAHTPGATSYTITASWTASATHTAVAKAGLFNASSSGTMAFTTLLNATATLASGDQLQVTWTVNI
jgi:uncharacterized membrane protein